MFFAAKTKFLFLIGFCAFANEFSGARDGLTDVRRASNLGAAQPQMFTHNTKPILERCQTDANTRLRLKYAPYYRVVESADGVNVVVDGQPMVMMSSNEYLGLSRHPKVIAAAKAALDQWGASPCGSRLANGSRAYHIEL